MANLSPTDEKPLTQTDEMPVVAPAPYINTGAPGVLTDDGTAWAGDQQPPHHIPGVIERLGQALANPMQTAKDAWNYPGSYVADAAHGVSNSIASAANIPKDVASGNMQANDPDSAGRMLNAAMLLSPASPASLGTKMTYAGAPSRDAIFAAGDKGFDGWNKSGIEYAPNQFSDWATQQQQGLFRDGIKNNETGAPNLHSEFNDMGAGVGPPPGAINLTPADLNAQRKAFSNVARNGVNSTERTAAAGARGDYMQLLANATPANAVAGASPAEAAKGLSNAVGNWAAGSRSEFLGNIDQNADLQANRANSGHAGGNPIRQNIASALRLNPQTGQSLFSKQGFNDAETNAAHGVVEGTPWTNQLRTAANLSGGGLGHAGLIGALLAAREGYDVAGVPGMLVGGGMPFAGAGVRALERAATQKQFDQLDGMVRARSPLAQSSGINLGSQPTFPSAQMRLQRALMSTQGQQPQDQNP